MFNTKEFIDLIFPIRCFGCGEYDAWICNHCAGRIVGTAQRVDEQLPFRQYLGHVYTFADYHDPLVAHVVSAFKYQFARDVGVCIGELMAEQLIRRLASRPEMQFDAVVPMPLALRRERWRGFNQSVILASVIAAQCNWPLGLTMVRRARLTESQMTLTADRRRQNVANAFAVIDPLYVKGRRILLIDDVITTGATCNECANVLLRAGAKDVSVAAFAQG